MISIENNFIISNTIIKVNGWNLMGQFFQALCNMYAAFELESEANFELVELATTDYHNSQNSKVISDSLVSCRLQQTHVQKSAEGLSEQSILINEKLPGRKNEKFIITKTLNVKLNTAETIFDKIVDFDFLQMKAKVATMNYMLQIRTMMMNHLI